MGKKKKYKALTAGLIASIPVVMKQTHEYHFKSGLQMRAEDREKINGLPVKDETIYKDAYPVHIAVNHKRKLKKLIDQYGADIIPLYTEAMQQSHQPNQ